VGILWEKNLEKNPVEPRRHCLGETTKKPPRNAQLKKIGKLERGGTDEEKRLAGAHATADVFGGRFAREAATNAVPCLRRDREEKYTLLRM